MIVRLLIILVVLLNSVTSNADVVTITENLPNPGDKTTTTVTYNTSYTTTGNLISQDFTDGTWFGTNQSTRHGNGTIAGVHGKYVETKIYQADGGLSNSLSEGFTSKLAADIWFWNKNQQSVIMSQSYTNDADETTTQTRTISSNATTAYTNYEDIMSIGANTSTNGSVKVRFDFTHEITSGHRAADIKNPALSLTYGTTTSSSSSAITYCWERTPNTCPQAVEDIADVIVDIEDDLVDIIVDIEQPKIEIVIDVPDYTWEPEEIEIDEPVFIVASIPVNIPMPEPEPDILEEEFNTKEITDAYDPIPVVETTTAPEPAAPEPEADPIAVVEQVDEPVEEQPSSEEVIAEQPIQETDSPKQEEVVEAEVEEERPEPTDEPMEEDIVAAEEPEVTEETPEVSVDVAAVEKYIDGKVQSQIEKIEATLVVVNELVSRAMVSNQVDISSYATMNNAIFDNRQLADGNPAFFNQIVLAGYSKNIYRDQVSLGSIDPIAQHNIKVNIAKDKTNQAYFKLKALLEARQ